MTSIEKPPHVVLRRMYNETLDEGFLVPKPWVLILDDLATRLDPTYEKKSTYRPKGETHLLTVQSALNV